MSLQTDIKEINSFTRELDMRVPWADLKEEYEKTFNEIRIKYSMPGFRKGRVPAVIIKKNYGHAIDIDFAEKAMKEYLEQAYTEAKLEPINTPQISELEFHEGKDLHFTAVIEIEPEVMLPKYEDKFKIFVVEKTPTPSDVELALKELQQKYSTLSIVEDGAKMGHLIMGDFQEIDEGGIPIIGEKTLGKYIKLGEGSFIEEAANVFIGAKVGSIVRTNPTIKGLKIWFEVTVEKVEEQHIPELDDDFVKTVDPDLGDLAELKSRIYNQIELNLKNELQESIKKDIKAYFIKESSLEVPTSWKDGYLKSIVEDLQKNQPAGGTLNNEELKKVFEPEAEKFLKWHLISKAVIKKEQIEVTKEVLQDKIDQLCEEDKSNAIQIKAFYKKRKNLDHLRDSMLDKLLFDKLNEFAEIQITKKTTDELRKVNV